MDEGEGEGEDKGKVKGSSLLWGRIQMALLTHIFITVQYVCCIDCDLNTAVSFVAKFARDLYLRYHSVVIVVLFTG